MADYVLYDSATGTILGLRKSIDGVYAGIDGKEGVLKVTRETLESITKDSIVKDGRVVEMSDEEKALRDKAESERIAQEKKVPTLEKLVSLLIRKGIITLKEIEDEIA